MRGKRTVAALIAIVMVISVIPFTAFAASSPSSWFTAEMSDANVKGLLTANASKDYHRAMTRIEFCELVVRMVEEILGRELELPATNVFIDTASEDVQKANKYGIVNGRTATTFDPNAPVSREEIAAMMYRALTGLEVSLGRSLLTVPTGSLSFNDTADIYGYAVEPIRYAVANGIFKGDDRNNFNPKNNITSEECVAVAVRSYNSAESKINAYLSQTQLLEKAADRLKIGYAHGDVQTGVSQNITLPTTGAGGVAITWASNNSSVISPYGAVYPTGASVTLTATLSIGSLSRTKTFTLTTTTLSGDQKLVANAKSALELGFYNENDSLESVTGRVFLPTTVLGLDVTWYSDRPSTVSTTGVVNVPSDATVLTVNLTASFKSGGVTGTKIFTLSVRNPLYAASNVSLHNITLGMTLAQVNSALSSYKSAYTLASGETWYIYHSDTSYNNFVAVAFRSNAVVGVYTMISGWESYLRDASTARTISVTEANAAANVEVAVFTDTYNANKQYAAFMYDSSTTIAGERVVQAAAVEGFVAELINAYRYLYGSGTGKNALTVDTLLSNSARSHSTEMDTNNYFSVTGLSGSTFQTRATAAGSGATILGGTIAYNSINPFDFLDSFIKTSTYRNYILSASAGQVGIGYSGSYTGVYKNLLTAVFSSSSLITSITASPTSLTATVGSTAYVSFTILPATFSESFTVVSSNTAVFTVNAQSTPSTNVRTYRITGISVGTAYIYVYNSSGALMRTVTVTISSAVYASSLVANNALVETNRTYQMTATTNPVSGPVVTWSLVKPYHASSSSSSYQKHISNVVSNTGVITTSGEPGTATVRATAQSSATTNRTSDATVYVASVNLPMTSVNLQSAGSTQSIVPTIACGTVTSGFTIAYSSSNQSVATVSNAGLITAVSAGTAIITVTVTRAGFSGSIVKTAQVTVQSSQYATSVAISGGNFELEIGATKQLSATTVPSNVTYSTRTWASGDSSIITVDQNGLVTAVREGSTYVYVEVNNTATTKIQGYVQVTVTKKVSTLLATSPTITITQGGSIYASNFYSTNPVGAVVVWTSEDTEKAYVDANGLIQAVGLGTTAIHGYIEAYGDYARSNTITISVIVLEAAPPTP